MTARSSIWRVRLRAPRGQGPTLLRLSAMMDGQIRAIRQGLDEEGFDMIPIMAYSTKFASAFYGPPAPPRGVS